MLWLLFIDEGKLTPQPLQLIDGLNLMLKYC